MKKPPLCSSKKNVLHKGGTRARPRRPKVPPPLRVRHGQHEGHAVTYQLQMVLCGKHDCSKLHGPYWYAFWRVGDKMRSRYIGRQFLTVGEKERRRVTQEENAKSADSEG